MPLVIPPGFADVAIELRGAGDPEPWYVTFGVDSSAASGDVNSIGATVNGAWESMMGVISNECLTTGCKISVGQDGEAPVRGFSSLDAAGYGDSVGAKLPQNCAALIHKDTSIGGRRARGRFYVPACLDEGAVSSVGLISATQVNAIQGAVDAFLVALQTNAIPCPMVVLHNSEGISPIIDPTPVEALRLDAVIATQRRRLR